MLCQLEEAQESLRSAKRTDTTVGSLDVQALYPSLDVEGSSEIVARFVRDSKVEIRGIDWRQTQVFVASNMDVHELKREGVLGLVPSRTKKRGPRPGSNTLELRRKKRKETGPAEQPVSDPSSKWTLTTPEESLSEEEKRKLLSLAVKIATRTIFCHHCYEFNGQVYRQSKGGPIGLRFTSIISRIVMDHWILVFLAKLLAAGVEIHGVMKYVDNVNLVMALLPLGTRWEKDALVTKEKWRVEDLEAGKDQESVTMEAVRVAACSVLPWLSFTADSPNQHPNLKVPMLDLQVWVCHPGPGEARDYDILAWSFFEKQTSSKKVLRASSAFSWRSKLITMNMEVWRRMRNCTRQLTLKARAKVLGTFVVKLRESGYVESTVSGMLESGLTFYTRKLRIELAGGPPINQRSEKDSVARKRAKLGARETWFSRRRGGAKETTSKDLGWTRPRQDPKGEGRRGRKTRTKYSTQGQGRQGDRVQGQQGGDGDARKDPKVLTTLLVPYTMGSRLKDRLWRMGLWPWWVEGRSGWWRRGGDVLSHLLTRNDPWASQRTCPDPGCVTCRSRVWLREQQKAARKSGTKLPKVLDQRMSPQCRREGVNYSLQCLDCALGGVRAIYWGGGAEGHPGKGTMSTTLGSCLKPHGAARGGGPWGPEAPLLVPDQLHRATPNVQGSQGVSADWPDVTRTQQHQ